MKTKGIIAIDAGGHSFKACVIDWETLGVVSDLVNVPIESSGSKEQLLGNFSHIVSETQAAADAMGVQIASIAFSCPGPMDYYGGISLMSHKWQAIKGVPIRQYLYENGVDASVPIFFCHDGTSLIFGHMATKMAEGCKSIAGYIIGTGLGFGIIKEGTPQNNELGVPKFALFKRPYGDSTLELNVASKGIPTLYGKILREKSDLTAKEIADLAFAGDVAAQGAYQEMGRILASSSYDLLAEHEVDCVVFGGRISHSYALFGPQFEQTLADHGVRLESIIQAQESETIAMQGVSYYAKTNFSTKKESVNEKVQ